MRKHYSRAKNEENLTGIDAAIRKYGAESFIVEEIEQCKNNKLDERERYWISYYDSYKNGYNLTTGGQFGSSHIFTDKEIEDMIQAYKELKYVKKVAEKFNCTQETASKILKANGVEIKIGGNNTQNIIGKGRPFKEGDGVKPVKLIELDKEFGSLKECSQWLIDNGYSKASSMKSARKGLSYALHNDKTYCGFHFEFI